MAFIQRGFKEVSEEEAPRRRGLIEKAILAGQSTEQFLQLNPVPEDKEFLLMFGGQNDGTE